VSDKNVEDALELRKMGVIEILEDGTVLKIMRRKSVSLAWVPRRTPSVICNPNRQGYLTYMWWDDTRQPRVVRVHRMVYACFNGELLDGYEIHHRDNNKVNNHPDNLEQVTHEENMRLAALDNLYPDTRGSKNSCARVTELVVERACELLQSGYNCPKTARELGIEVHIIHNIIRRKTWQHLDCVKHLIAAWPTLVRSRRNG
jgi:hypothetical protein